MTRIFPAEIIGASQMRQADELTIESGTESFELMLNAAAAVADEITKHLDNNKKALVLCGPGNNGGDGFMAAKILKDRGWQVRVSCLTDVNNLKGDAAKAAAEWGEEVTSFAQTEPAPSEIVVDAIFGTGFHGILADEIAILFQKIKDVKAVVVAVDIPSGVNGDTGEADRNTLHASMTVTFFRKKLGHVIMPGLAYSGPTAIHDIGIKRGVLETTGIAAYENHPFLWQNRLRRKSLHDNKYTLGHAIILGGSRMTGAAMLAAHSALRVRAGMCTIAAPMEAATAYQSYLPSLIYEPYGDLSLFAEHIADRRRSAVLIGPGAGKEDAYNLRQAIIKCCELGERKSIVLDADALNVFQGFREELFEVLHKRCVLTPHEGEFERIFDDLEGIKPLRAIEAAAISGAVMLLKGSDTVIATPDGKCVINTNGPPDLATAGSGDVLAGMITGLMAQGIPAFESACAASWIHGEAAYSFGPGLISSDLPDLIPQVLKELS
jgi:NAD(P)H-hydrate epimerase